MVQQHKKAAARTAASSPASSGSSSSSRSIHGTMSSAFLGVSSSTHSHSQSQLRRSSPSLYPPPAPVPAQLPGHLASRGSAASGGSASGSSSSQFHQISPSPRPVAKRRPSPSSRRCTHSLPSPFLSELSSICRMGTNIFGDLNAQEIMAQRPFLRGHGQQEQEMTRSSSSLTMPHHHTPIPSGEFSGLPPASPGLRGFAQPPLQLQLQEQQAQSSLSSLQPTPAGFPLPESQSQPQQMPPSSSGFEPPVASQHSATYLAPLPSWSTILQSSWCHAQPSSGDSQLPPPLPPSLEIQIPQHGVPPLGQLPQNKNGSSSTESTPSTCFVQPSSNSETYELPPLPESLQMPSPLLHQVNKAGGSSNSMENSNPVPAVPKLIFGGMDRPGLPPLPPALGAGSASSSVSRRGRTKEHLSEADIEMISKDNRLKEVAITEPMRVRRILRNRENVARLKLQKANHFQDLECQANALKLECESLCAEVQSRQELLDNLKTEIHEAEIKFTGLNEQVKLSEALNRQLQSELERLKLPEINMVCANGVHNPKSS